MNTVSRLCSCIMLGFMPAMVLSAQEQIDTLMIPSRAVILTGEKTAPGAARLVSVLYNTEELKFNDPRAPRFLFLDREGKMALGIGGHVKGTMQYDFDGSVDDGSNFTTYKIPAPMNPAQRNQFFANASHSTVFLKMVGNTTRFGYFSAYVQTDFTGGNDNELKLKKAYATLGYVTAGLAPSTFQDGAADVPTIDDQGPSGAVSRTNVMFQYKPRIGKHVTLAVSVEMPEATYTTNATTEVIKQRVPDIPVFVQYAWGGGNSHVRLSGLLRNLSYRDLASSQNRFVTGWGVQLSGMVALPYGFTVYYEGMYGKGYQSYFNDFDGTGLDLIPSGEAGRLIAPGALGVVGGVKYQPLPNLFMSTGYSQSRLYDQHNMSPDTYRYGQYFVVNAFYSLLDDLQFGLEYIHGSRTNINRTKGNANRLMAMLQYSF